NSDGVVCLQKQDTQGIPPEVDYTLKTREDWEKHYKHRLVFSKERVELGTVWENGKAAPFMLALDYLKDPSKWNDPLLFYCGSMVGYIRNLLGLENFSY